MNKNFEKLKRCVDSWGGGKYKAGNIIESPHEPYGEYVIGVYKIAADEFLTLDPYKLFSNTLGTYYEHCEYGDEIGMILITPEKQVLQTERRDRHG